MKSMSQHHYYLFEGQVHYLGRLESEQAVQAERTRMGPFKRVLTEEDLRKLENSIWEAYATAIEALPPNQPMKDQSWLNITRASILRILRWSTVRNLLDAIAGCLQDDPDSDGTPYAHPAFYRGEAAATAGITGRLRAILDGTDNGSGVLGHEGLEEIRRQLLKRDWMMRDLNERLRALHKQMTGQDVSADLTAGEPAANPDTKQP